MPQLDPTWFASQLFWLVIAFTTLYVVLSKLVLPPLLKVMAQRESTVSNDLSLAERFKAEAEAARIEYERTLNEARAQAQKIVSDIELEYKAKAEAASAAMDKDIASKLTEAERRITAKKDELIASLTPTAGELASMIVEKLTQRTPEDSKVSAAITHISKARARG